MLTKTDLAMIRRCRGDHSRLGYALMLCYLRHPGRPLRTNERPPAALVAFVAEQIDVRPEAVDGYLASEQNRRRHAAELQDRLQLRPFGKHAAAELAETLHPHAIENYRFFHLAELAMEECRGRRIVVPHRGAWNASVLVFAFGHGGDRATNDRWPVGRPTATAGCADTTPGGNRPKLARRAAADAAGTKLTAMLGLIERLNHVRAIGIDAAHGHGVHQSRLVQLAREAGRTTAQHLAGYERQRRHATLAAITLISAPP